MNAANNKEERFITSDMLDWTLKDVKVELESWVSNHTLVKNMKDIDPVTKHPKGAVMQLVTLDYTGIPLRAVIRKAGATDRIKYQNGYARVADPKEFLLNEDGSVIKKVTLIVAKFFKGRVTQSAFVKATKGVENLNNLDELRILREKIDEKIKEANK